MKKINDKRGFTLVELIIVIAILAVLASIAVPNLLGSVEKSKIAKDEANAKLIGDAIVMAIAEGDVSANIVEDGRHVRDNHTTMTMVKKRLDPLPKPVSKKYKGPEDWGYFWYKIVDGKVIVYVQDASTITYLYPTVKDPVDK